MPWNLELKSGPENLGLADALAEFLDSVEIVPGTLVTSFARELVDRLRARRSDLPTGLIIGRPGLRDGDLAAPHEILSVAHHLLDEAFMERARSAGKQVHAWIVNEKEEVRRLVELGVAVLITSRPAQVAAWLAGGSA